MRALAENYCSFAYSALACFRDVISAQRGGFQRGDCGTPVLNI